MNKVLGSRNTLFIKTDRMPENAPHGRPPGGRRPPRDVGLSGRQGGDHRTRQGGERQGRYGGAPVPPPSPLAEHPRLSDE